MTKLRILNKKDNLLDYPGRTIIIIKISWGGRQECQIQRKCEDRNSGPSDGGSL